MFSEIEFESSFSNLNHNLLRLSSNDYDIRTFNGILKGMNPIWGLTEIIKNVNFQDDSNFKSFIPDSTREQYKELIKLLKDHPQALVKVEKLLTRNIIYIGAECEDLGYIDVIGEYNTLNELLMSKYLFLEKVQYPTYSCLMDTWDNLKPQIIFFSWNEVRFNFKR
jgi:hypothetical protein